MRRLSRRLMLLLAGGVLLLAALASVQLSTGAGRAHACVCPEDFEAPLEALEGATAVFSGKVVDGLIPYRGAWRRAYIQVDTVWKGSVTATTFVSNAAPCARDHWVQGETYLIYATADPSGFLVASICGRTWLLEHRDDDLRALGEGWPPAPDPDVTDAEADSVPLPAWPLVVPAATIALIAAVAILIRPLRRRDSAR